MKNLRNKGITLVALIITIIILLILVGVGIDITTDGKLIDRAQDAVDKTNDKVSQQQNRVDELMGELDRIEESQIKEATAGQRTHKTLPYYSNKKTAIIPEGFTVSGLASENKIDEGLVIYLIPEGTTIDWTNGTEVANVKKTYDQFVWIPIKNTTDASAQDINDMFICQAKTADNGVCVIGLDSEGKAECKTEAHKAANAAKAKLMAGRLYATSTGEKFEVAITEVYTEGTGLREPDVLTDTTYADGNSTHLGYMSGILGTTGYDSITSFKTTLQNEYNEIVAKVYKSQGFWVGRYETSGMKNAATGYDIKVVAGANISKVNWYYMYAQQKKYAEDNNLNNVTSSMIQGSAYDQVMKFVDPNSSWIKTTGKVSHNLSNVYQTGGTNYTGSITYNDVAKNIYDLEGNVRAWTTEACSAYARVSRGGDYEDSYSASFRYAYAPLSINPLYGSVSALYVTL